jgi:hypothetical protein
LQAKRFTKEVKEKNGKRKASTERKPCFFDKVFFFKERF